MTSFLEEFSDETQIMVSNIVGILSVLIFIYTSYKSNYFNDLYLATNERILSFMKEIKGKGFWFALIAVVISISISCYSIYLNTKNAIYSSNIFNRVAALLGVLTTMVGLGFGVYNYKNIFKLFIIMFLVWILIFGMLATLFNGEKTESR